MTQDRYVDGNAFAAAFIELFGREMTDAKSCCGGCEAINRLGALLVFNQAPGDVVRCPSCGTVQLVAVERPGGLRFHFAGLRWIEPIRAGAEARPDNAASG